MSRDRVRAKVMHFGGTGLCIYAKRFKRGRFAQPWRDDGDSPLTLTVSELDVFLDGSTLIPTRIYSTPSLRLLPVLASSRIRKIS